MRCARALWGRSRTVRVLVLLLIDKRDRVSAIQLTVLTNRRLETKLSERRNDHANRCGGNH